MRPGRFVFDDEEKALCDEVCDWLEPLAQEAGVSRVAEVLRTNDVRLSRNALSSVVNDRRWRSRRNAVRQLWLKERDGLLKCSDMKQLEAWAAERDARWTSDTRTEGDGTGAPAGVGDVAAAVVSPDAEPMGRDFPPFQVGLPAAQYGVADIAEGNAASETPASCLDVAASDSAGADGGVRARDTETIVGPPRSEQPAGQVSGVEGDVPDGR